MKICLRSLFAVLGLQALGGAYDIHIGDRTAPIPTLHAPVTVPWHK